MNVLIRLCFILVIGFFGANKLFISRYYGIRFK
ncbi:hypothetical protein HPLT_05070 [Helicobacter pylori Lithuania75]|nr:hypothetical protein HPLT_05070 [Helicobacter pylori Lithuania75]